MFHKAYSISHGNHGFANDKWDFGFIKEAFDKNGALILTSEMKKIIAISEDQYKRGEFKTHEEVMAETELWLKERT